MLQPVEAHRIAFYAKQRKKCLISPSSFCLSISFSYLPQLRQIALVILVLEAPAIKDQGEAFTQVLAVVRTQVLAVVHTQALAVAHTQVLAVAHTQVLAVAHTQVLAVVVTLALEAKIQIDGIGQIQIADDVCSTW